MEIPLSLDFSITLDKMTRRQKDYTGGLSRTDESKGLPSSDTLSGLTPKLGWCHQRRQGSIFSMYVSPLNILRYVWSLCLLWNLVAGESTEIEIFIRSDITQPQGRKAENESFTLPAILCGEKSVREGCEKERERRDEPSHVRQGIWVWLWRDLDIHEFTAFDFLTTGEPHTCTHNRNKSNIDCTASLNAPLIPYRADQTLSQRSERFLPANTSRVVPESPGHHGPNDVLRFILYKTPRLHHCTEEKLHS